MSEKMSVSQMREFVKKFAVAQQEHQSLRTHTAIAEKILEFTASSSFRKRLNAEQSTFFTFLMLLIYIFTSLFISIYENEFILTFF
jgi:hypothetical protein